MPPKMSLILRLALTNTCSGEAPGELCRSGRYDLPLLECSAAGDGTGVATVPDIVATGPGSNLSTMDLAGNGTVRR